jgi:hypothetical protein
MAVKLARLVRIELMVRLALRRLAFRLDYMPPNLSFEMLIIRSTPIPGAPSFV